MSKCGERYRLVSNDTTGPRGGRLRAVHAECVDCGRHGKPEYVRPNRSVNVHAIVAMLKGHECPTPRVVPADERLLLAASSLIRSGEPISLRFAVEYLGAIPSLPEAAAAAWKTCASGYAMASFIGARTGNAGHGYAMSSADGTEAMAALDMERRSLRLTLNGPQATVADVLRAIVAIEGVRAVARQAEHAKALAIGGAR